MIFSVRKGYEEVTPIQFESMNDALRISLWNLLEQVWDELFNQSQSYSRPNVFNQILNYCWTDFFKLPIHQFNRLTPHQMVIRIRELYFRLEWHQVYSFLEFIIRPVEYYVEAKNNFKDEFNLILEQENSAWRFVNNLITPIPSAQDIEAIEAVHNVGTETEQHIKNSLSALAAKNYRECGKEAVLGLEAYAREVTNEKSMILSDICKKKKLPLHGGLQNSINNFYGWASDQLRHAIKKDSQEVTYVIGLSVLNISVNYINLIKDGQYLISSD